MENTTARLVICELDSPLKPGQLAAAEYLADMIQQCLKRPDYENHTYNEMLDEAILKLLRGETVERGKMEKLVRLLGWGEENEYVCVCVDMDPGESEFVNATSLLQRGGGQDRREQGFVAAAADVPADQCCYEQKLHLGSGLYSQRRTVPGRNQPSVCGSFQAPGLLSSGRGGS